MAPEPRPRTLKFGAGRVLYQSFRHRIWKDGGWQKASPLYADRSDGSRFNASDGSFGVSYLAESEAGAFLETLVRSELKGYSVEDVAERQLATIEVLEDLELVQLYGVGLKRNGVTSAISSTDDEIYDASQNASRSWYHGSDVDGIIYMSRLDDEIRCVALYDRAIAKVREIQRVEWLDAAAFSASVRDYELYEVP